MNPLDKSSINWNMPNKRRLEAQLVKRRERRHRKGIPVPGSSLELAEAEIDAIIEERKREREHAEVADVWDQLVAEAESSITN